jgi:hypothetical protein
MNNKVFLLLSGFICSAFCSTAQNQEYSKYIKQADNLYDKKEYKQSGDAYAKAFVAMGNKGFPNDRYNAACTWALAGEKDSAFVQLFKVAQNSGYSDLGHLSVDPDLNSIRSDKRWEEVVAIVKQNKEKAEANLNKPLVAILDTVHMEDQKYRMQIEGIEKQYGRDSKEMKDLWRTIQEKDSINHIKVTKILDEYGWLGADVIGDKGNRTLFLVIQHADYNSQLKYLPMMREAVKNKKANASALALLEDRVALRGGKKQVYGSQVGRFESGEYYVQPLEDPDNVDKRRAEVGLSPLATYVGRWNITWNAEEYKKKLPEIEKYELEMEAKMKSSKK